MTDCNTIWGQVVLLGLAAQPSALRACVIRMCDTPGRDGSGFGRSWMGRSRGRGEEESFLFEAGVVAIDEGTDGADFWDGGGAEAGE